MHPKAKFVPFWRLQPLLVDITVAGSNTPLSDPIPGPTPHRVERSDSGSNLADRIVGRSSFSKSSSSERHEKHNSTGGSGRDLHAERQSTPTPGHSHHRSVDSGMVHSSPPSDHSSHSGQGHVSHYTLRIGWLPASAVWKWLPATAAASPPPLGLEKMPSYTGLSVLSGSHYPCDVPHMFFHQPNASLKKHHSTTSSTHLSSYDDKDRDDKQERDERVHSLRIFLGLLDDAPCWAIDVSSLPNPKQHAPFMFPGAKFCDVRAALTLISPADSSILGQGLQLLAWHRDTPLCSSCGSALAPSNGGFKRVCQHSSCRKREVYPRTDPSAIMLVVRGDYCLLGRKAIWPAGRFSCLAGFVDPSETLEDAVRREVWEEAGIRVGRTRYMKSQPWPFPRSLMLGFIAEALNEDITVDKDEMETVQWFHKSEVVKALCNSVRTENAEAQMFCVPPPPIIAHYLINAWAVKGETFLPRCGSANQPISSLAANLDPMTSPMVHGRSLPMGH